MSHRYFALVHSAEQHRSDAFASMSRELCQLGLEPRLSSQHLTLFISSETPATDIPGRGILVGDVFRGTQHASCLSAERLTAPGDVDLSRHVLRKFWGEYLLFETAELGSGCFRVTRDPSGGVGCVYAMDGPWGFITSDVTLAIALGIYRKEVDWDFVESCLQYPHVKAEQTGLIGVRELLPGSALRVCASASSVTQAWSPWPFVDRHARFNHVEEASGAVGAAVASVVGAMAGIDRSILLELSGGLDSSIVGMCLQNTSARVSCGTLATPVPGGDERQYAKLVAEALGAKLYVDVLRLDEMTVDYPIPPQGVTPRVGLVQYASNELKEQLGKSLGVTSFYSGAGGDTVFGYLKSAAPAVDAFQAKGLAAGTASLRDLSELHRCTLWKAGLLTLQKSLRAPKPPCVADRTFLAPAEVRPAPRHPWFIAADGTLHGDRARVFDLASTQIYRDATPRGLARPLRMPLLSQPVVEICLRVPSWMWITGGRDRAVARQAFSESLPRQILERRSKGSLVGYLGAVYRRTRPHIEQFLLTGQLQARELLDEDALRTHLHAPPAPRDQTFMRVLDLCMIENWVRQQR